MRHDPEDLDRVIDYCCEHYFTQPNYWTIHDKPNFVLWNIATFAAELGGADAAHAGLERMNARARRHGLPGLYFTANIGCCDDNVYCCGYDRVPAAHAMGFESVFAYNIVRTPGYATLSNEAPFTPYEDVMRSHQHCWREIEKVGRAAPPGGDRRL